jgi:hypothetical protein
MSASIVDRQHVREVELAVECVTLADELERLASLTLRRAAVLKSQARELAGELDGLGE